MIRHAGRALALFAAGALFAGGAWAQPTLTQSVESAYLVAEELLGSADGTVIKLSSAGSTNAAPQPLVKLTVGQGTSSSSGIEEDNTAELTFTLSGAVFGQNVGSSTLELRNASDAQIAGLATEVMSGGNTGDGSVTFLIEATADIDNDNALTFKVPDLNVTPTTVGTTTATPPVPLRGASIVASITEKRAVKSDTHNPFPSKVLGANDTPATSNAAAMNNTEKRQVVKLADVVSISLGKGGKATVALDARTVFADANDTYKAAGAKTATKALKVGSLTVTIKGGDAPPANNGDAVANRVWTLDPAKPAVNYGTNNTSATDDDTLDPSLAGNVDVVVKGAYKTGDMLVYGAQDTKAKIADGMAAVSVPIALGGAATDFTYVPGGVDPLRPGTISAVASLNFSRAGNDAGKAAMSSGEISYQGVSIEAYAHGVVRGGGADSSFLRVRCANATDCTVFLDCHDQAGTNYFDEAGTVDAGATTAWTSGQIATALGGGWSTGRGACDLLSDGTLEVQHMVRSHGILVNNSAVVGRSLSEMRLDSIDKALADICSSVEGHTGRAQTPENPTADNPITVHKIAASVCRNQKASGGGGLTTYDTTPGDDSTL